ncbi:MAG: hypothetical protein ACOYNN_02335 [Terrimicrobiaceae bacterium]
MILVTLLLPLSACAGKAPVPRDRSAAEGSEPEEERMTQGALQLQVMDFSDQFVSAMSAALDAYIAAEPDPAKRVAARAWKVRYASAAMTIAASRDPRTNLLDMVVFIAAGKWAVDHYWVPKVFGEQASALSDVYREQDRAAWELAGRVLSLKQQSDLRGLIRQWEKDHPNRLDVADIRLRNLDGVRLNAFDEGLAARGILAGLRRFMGRVDTSLLYGERVMFYLERTPHILSQQTELTLAQIGEAFPIATVRPQEFAEVVRELPAILQEGIDRNQGTLDTLLPKIETTLDNANILAASLDRTLVSLRQFSEANTDPTAPPVDPTKLLDQTTTALAHLDSSVQGLNQILEKTAMGGLPAEQISQLIDQQTTRVLDAAFHRLIVLLAAFFGGTVVVLLLAKFLFGRGKSKAASTD